ncbi:NADP-dependent 3-hydroxy acid dehydrogenase YdfG [Pseudomonas sp. GGS8]|uniref:SDR family oxidoreductase n=1 Tax=Pseudomonas sp. GGS8 TaxID=2817892 RepID=UPI00209CEBF7|nr:SDR family oxidoreductase [Pseudomonas sp. GGS8]MCP1446213.1 NADP-dependent 3-hydroxy acid dehydrogenase YdfG [Pseudomonas sp. GGS8]
MKTAVVTGASSGIGEACARTLARSGWRVFLVARRGDRLEQIADETGGRAIVLDVTQAREEDLGQICECDLLVNCAGGAIGLDAVDTASAEDWTNMFNSNVLGTLRMTQLLLPRLIASQGAIINITSTAALASYEGGGGYCAAKGAQRALTQSLRLEMKGVPVRITEVLPGMVHTPEFSLNRFRGDAERVSALYKDVDRPLSADDVAQVVAWVADQPAHVNVDEIVVRPVAQRAQHALFRGSLGWLEQRADKSPLNEGAR